MPGTHLLPPNLLKLFAPRPPLPYTRPLDRDIDRVRPKNVGGVGELLAVAVPGRPGICERLKGFALFEGGYVYMTAFCFLRFKMNTLGTRFVQE